MRVRRKEQGESSSAVGWSSCGVWGAGCGVRGAGAGALAVPAAAAGGGAASRPTRPRQRAPAGQPITHMQQHAVSTSPAHPPASLSYALRVLAPLLRRRSRCRVWKRGSHVMYPCNISFWSSLRVNKLSLIPYFICTVVTKPSPYGQMNRWINIALDTSG